ADDHDVGLGGEKLETAIGGAIVEHDEPLDPEGTVMGEEGVEEEGFIARDAAHRHRMAAEHRVVADLERWQPVDAHRVLVLHRRGSQAAPPAIARNLPFEARSSS